MFLRQSTSQVIRFGPCLDIGDGVTEETALTLAQADMRLSKDGGAFAQKNAAGNATHDSDGWYSTTLDTTDTATVGILKLNVHQPANMFPVWETFYVVEEAVYDAMYGAAAEGPLQATTAGRTLDILATGEVPIDFDTSIGTLAAAQIEASALDGKGDWNIGKTGYSLTQSFPSNFADMSITITTGLVDITQTAADKVWATAARVLTAGTNIALAKGVGVTGFNDLSAAQVNTEADTALNDFFTSSAQLVDDIWDEVITGAIHNTTNSAGRRLRFIAENGSYADGAVWIDTINGTAGTTDYENGTEVNPVDSIADANTIATSIGLSRFRILPGSSITLAATQSNQAFIGSVWTLALGGQDISGSVFVGATVSGVASGTGTHQDFTECHMNGTSHIKGTHLRSCGIGGTLILVEAGEFITSGCYSSIAGAATPTLDFGAALNSSNVSFRNYSGGIELQNMGAGTGTYNMSLEGRGQVIFNANCSATSNISIRGLFSVTDNAGGAITVTEDARYNSSLVNAEVLDVMNTDTITLPGQTAPPLAPTHRQAIGWLYKIMRNRKTQTATQWSLLADDESTVDAKATVSDDATTAIKQEIESGP